MDKKNMLNKMIHLGFVITTIQLTKLSAKKQDTEIKKAL
jgi:hypothetical protein